MKWTLHCHPATPSAVVRAMEVQVLREGKRQFALCYVLHGDIASLRIPPRRESRRVDELWQHTCCELFVGDAENDSYCELNFAPSTEWAAYAFESYRCSMQQAKLPVPRIQVSGTREEWRLETSVDLTAQELGSQLKFGTTAVIEENDGRKSYWALRHPTERPDFHHRDGWIAQV